ncbi:MAG: hypothetical protein E7597_05730 [Ruminococcaceae bacterium]|nr:hypothetical protein [Oscillospiraceae bacterium]
MKKLIIVLLAVFMLGCAVSASAVSDADNDILKVIAPVNKARAFSEYFGDDAKYGFDVKGYVDLGDGPELIGSTFDGYGYHTFLNVNAQGGAMSGRLDEVAGEDFDLAAAISAMSYNCAGEAVQNIGGLNLKLDNSFVGEGNLVKISYTVSNTTENAVVFSLATTADVQVNNDDNAELRILPSGKGAKLVSAGSNCIFTVDGAEGGLDSLWIGEWSEDYFVNMFGDSPDDAVFSDGDSAICWSWTDRTIAPMESLNFYVLIEVGANTAPSVSVERTDAAFKDFINVDISDPNLGTADLHYIINNGEEQIIENISLTEGNAVHSISVEDLVCGTSHSIKLWAVDDTEQRSEDLVIVFEKAHDLSIPYVETEASATKAGTATTHCHSCDYTNTQSITYGDANTDGTVNSLDAALILKYDALIETDIIPLKLMMADVTGDGIVNSLDAAQILKYDALLVESFENAAFSSDTYASLCVEYYGYYGCDGCLPEEEESSEETDALEAIIGSWTGMNAAGELKNYVFFEDGIGTVAIGDIVYDVEWSIDGDSISIVKAQDDIAIYNEQALFTLMGDALVLTDEDGENSVYVKDKEGYESTDLMGDWLYSAPNGDFIKFTFDSDGKVLAVYPEDSAEADWSTDGETLVIDELHINTTYCIINDKLFMTVGEESCMFIKDDEPIFTDDDRLDGNWTNVDSDSPLKSITVKGFNAYCLYDALIESDIGVNNNRINISGILNGWYTIEDGKLLLLQDRTFYVFDFLELSNGFPSPVPADRTNYAEDASYTVSVDGEAATDALYPANTYLWGDMELKKLTDDHSMDTGKIDSNGAQATVSVIFLRGGKDLEIVLDLGESYGDIEGVAFCGVRNGGGFGFDIFGTKLYISENSENWGDALTASFSAQPMEGAPLIGGTEDEAGTLQNYHFVYQFSSEVSGRYVKISFPATEALMQFDEILVLN